MPEAGTQDNVQISKPVGSKSGRQLPRRRLSVVAAVVLKVAAASLLGSLRNLSGGRLVSGDIDGLPDGLPLDLGLALGRGRGRLLVLLGSGSGNLNSRGGRGGSGSLSSRDGRDGSGGRGDDGGVLNDFGEVGDSGQDRSLGLLGLLGGLGLARLARLARLLGLLGSRLAGSAVGPALHNVAAGEGVHDAINLLVNLGLDRALVLVQAVEETGALVHALGAGIACINDVLKELLIPATKEVGVRAVSSSITVGQNKGLLVNTRGPAVLEVGSVPVDLDEQVGNVDVTLGAVLVAVVDSRPSHVLAIGGETSLGVVARGEVDVGTQRRVLAIAVLVGETNTLTLVDGITHTREGAVGGSVPRGRAVVVVHARASPLDGLDGAIIGKIKDSLGRLGRSANIGIATDHLEANREGLDIVMGLLKEVVGVDVVDVDRLNGTVVWVLEVQRGVPVGRVVALDLGSAALGLDHVLSSGGHAEAAATLDAVDVLAGLSGADVGVHTALGELLAVEAEDGKGALLMGSQGTGGHGRDGGGNGELHVFEGLTVEGV
jgi:hypothetical protein